MKNINKNSIKPIKIRIKIFYFRSKRPIDKTCITVIKYSGTLHKNIDMYTYKVWQSIVTI